jgi:hypothetical protein
MQDGVCVQLSSSVRGIADQQLMAPTKPATWLGFHVFPMSLFYGVL